MYKSISRDIISVSPCCPNIMRWKRQESTFAKLVVLDDISKLPMHPSAEEISYGYLIGTHLYVYVGSGGDVAEGAYADCGIFKGESAYETAVRNGYEGTEQEWLDSLHAPLAHVTTDEIEDALSYVPVSPAQLASKVDKVSGKGLSANDFTDAYKTKLDNVDSAVTTAQESALLAQQTLNSLADVLAEASVDESVIDVAEVSSQLAATELQVETNKNQVFGSTKNYTAGRAIMNTGATFAKEGWNCSAYIDVSAYWLESGNSITWYHGAFDTNACLCLYDDNKEFLTYRANSSTSGGTATNRTVTGIAFPATKYIRFSYLASYTGAKLIVNGVVVWKPADTVAGLVPFMEEASADIESIQEDTQRKQLTTTVMAQTNMQTLAMTDVLGKWHEATALSMADTNTDVRKRFRSSSTSGTDRTGWRVLLGDCVPGDKYIVSGWSATTSTNHLLWAYYDADFNILSNKAKNGTTYTDYVTTAPEGAAYIGINWYHQGEEPVTTAKFFKIANGTLRQIVENLQELVGAYGKTDILTFNPEQTMLPKIIASRRTANPLTIAHFSDMHGTSATQLKRFIEFCDYYNSRIDVRLNTGDTVQNSYGDLPSSLSDWWYMKAAGSENILNVIGNHDVAAYSSGTYDWTAHVGEDAYEAFISPFIENWGVESGGVNTCYYYKDFSDSGIRFIVLDMPGYDTVQDEWFAGLLAGALSGGMTVVIASHFPGAKVDALPSRFTSLSRSTTGATTVSYMQNGALFAAAVKRVDTFISNGGSFACWLVGHTHYDFLSTVASFQEGDGNFGRPDITIDNTQLVVTIDTSSSATAQTTYSDIDHTAGTKLQDCFNLVTIDAANKLIKIVRVGCDTDKWMRKKDTLCINYETQTIVE